MSLCNVIKLLNYVLNLDMQNIFREYFTIKNMSNFGVKV
jgi:hypothetical protein